MDGVGSLVVRTAAAGAASVLCCTACAMCCWWYIITMVIALLVWVIHHWMQEIGDDVVFSAVTAVAHQVVHRVIRVHKVPTTAPTTTIVYNLDAFR